MDEQEKHTMQQVGEDSFECPTCGRFIKVTSWQPFKYTVLNPGDANATHSGGVGLTMGETGVLQDNIFREYLASLE